MILKMLGVLSTVLISGASHAVTLDDFRYGRPEPVNRLAEFSECEEQLGLWPTATEFFEVEDALFSARDYFERWRTAPSGVDFATETFPETVKLNDRIMALIGRFAIPESTLKQLDHAHVLMSFIQYYLGYSATDAELFALGNELTDEINAYAHIEDPPDDIRIRWLEDIMLLSQQSFLAKAKGGSKFPPPDELHAVAQQLRGQPVD